MKKLLIPGLLAVSLFTAQYVGAQNEKKYRLEVPEQLQKKPILDAIEENISYTVPKLRDSKSCQDCKTNYTVKYQTTAAEFGTDKAGKKLFVFKGSLVVYDSTGKGINRVVLINPETDEQVFYDVTDNGKPVNPAPLLITSRQAHVEDVDGLKKYFRNNNQDPQAYNEESFLRAAKEKILDMRENVRKLEKQRGRNL